MGLEPNRIKAVLFDIDGTLSDSDDQMVEKAERFLWPFLFFLNAERRMKTARWLVMAVESPGNFIYNLADRFDMDSFFIRALDRRSRQRRSRPRTYRLIPGVCETLDALKGRYRMGIVSARDEHASRGFIEKFGLSKYFSVIVTSQTVRHTKPFPDPLLYAAHELGVDPDACVMVGDTTVDMRAAKLSGMQAVGVLCGFGSEGELRRAGADLILPSLHELPVVLGIQN